MATAFTADAISPCRPPFFRDPELEDLPLADRDFEPEPPPELLLDEDRDLEEPELFFELDEPELFLEELPDDDERDPLFDDERPDEALLRDEPPDEVVLPAELPDEELLRDEDDFEPPEVDRDPEVADFELPDFDEPDFDEPDFDEPDFDAPDFDEPDFDEPDLDELDLDDVDLDEPDLDADDFEPGEDFFEPEPEPVDFLLEAFFVCGILFPPF